MPKIFVLKEIQRSSQMRLRVYQIAEVSNLRICIWRKSATQRMSRVSEKHYLIVISIDQLVTATVMVGADISRDFFFHMSVKWCILCISGILKNVWTINFRSHDNKFVFSVVLVNSAGIPQNFVNNTLVGRPASCSGSFSKLYNHFKSNAV